MNHLLAMRIFIKVVEAGSFIGAANQLQLPRSTVSKLFNDLEKHLATRLINRTTRSISITPEGEEYYRRAVRLVAEIEDADDAVRGKKLEPRGQLRVEAHPTFAQHILIPQLPDFNRRYPQITIALGISNRAANIIGEGVDCAIRAGDIGDDSLVARHLFDAEMLTCASPAYLDQMGVPKQPEELGEHILVGFFSHNDAKMKPLIFDQASRRQEIKTLSFSTNEDNGQIALMLAGLGVGQNLRTVIQPYLETGQLVEILSDWTHPALPFHVIYPTGRHQSTRRKVFIDWLIERFQKVGGSS